MPARTGEQYIKGLQQQEREVWLGGERVKDVTTHPGLANGVRSVAALYDMQHDPTLRDEMTYVSPTSGDRVGLSFIIPRTKLELELRRTMMLHWARATCGMVGRSPDFMNVTIAAWSAAETGAGIVVNGARVLATLGPLADEIAVYSPRLARHTEPHSPFALNFAIPCGTPGLRFLCRESFDLGRSHFDHPLGSRFEEMDCVVFFDDVLVPWERVFLLGDVDLLNGTAMTTHSAAHTAHQNAAKNLAKCEFVLGVALLMTETLGNAQLPHSEERLGELMMYTELMRACMRSAEADAELDQWGVMCPVPLQIELTRNLFMTAYPRMVEILQLLGSSSFLITPSEADFQSPLAPHIEQYLATDTTAARDRVKLFRLAWDVAGSAFGSRQVLYERFFASDPLSRARVLISMYPKEHAIERVKEFLERDDTVS